VAVKQPQFEEALPSKKQSAGKNFTGRLGSATFTGQKGHQE